MNYPLDTASTPRRHPYIFPQESRGPSPMDLACRRVELPFVRYRRGVPEAGLAGYDYLVTLPNPRHPMPPPRTIRHHCDDFRTRACWGTASDAAADLALNVLAAYLPFSIGDRLGAVRAWDGTIVSRRADRNYHAFKMRFLAKMPPAGGVVPEVTIRAWIQEQEPSLF